MAASLTLSAPASPFPERTSFPCRRLYTRTPHRRSLGLFASLRRLLFGDRAKRAHVSDHGAFMRTLGRAWAVPMTLVFSFGALITLGQHQITILVGQYQRHEPLDFVVLALLAITFVIVGGMDLTLAQLRRRAARRATARRGSREGSLHPWRSAAGVAGLAD